MKLSRENLRILLVDDDANDVDLLCRALHDEGFKQTITHFTNGSIALQYFRYTKATGSAAPHIILLDLNMPLIDGVRALRHLREVSPFRQLPVIILTGAEDAAKRCEVAKLGIFRFLKKQYDRTNVIAALNDFMAFYNNEDDAMVARRNVAFVIPDKTEMGLSHKSRIHLF